VLFGSVGEKAEVADTHEAVGEHVEEKTADEFVGVKRQSLFSIPVFAISITQGDQAVLHVEDTVVGKSDAVGVAAEIIKDRVWGAERLLRINHPVLFTQCFEFLAWGRDFSLVTGML